MSKMQSTETKNNIREFVLGLSSGFVMSTFLFIGIVVVNSQNPSVRKSQTTSETKAYDSFGDEVLKDIDLEGSTAITLGFESGKRLSVSSYRPIQITMHTEPWKDPVIDSD